MKKYDYKWILNKLRYIFFEEAKTIIIKKPPKKSWNDHESRDGSGKTKLE